MVSADTEYPTRNASRRAVIAGILALPIVSPAKAEVAAEIDPFEEVRCRAEALAESMAVAHGWQFRISIDHDAKTAVVCPLV